MFICLYKHDAENNRYRFYALSIQPHLFGGWSLLCEWGRMGEPGQVKIAMHASEAQAQAAFDKKLREKKRSGYGSTLDHPHASTEAGADQSYG